MDKKLSGLDTAKYHGTLPINLLKTMDANAQLELKENCKLSKLFCSEDWIQFVKDMDTHYAAAEMEDPVVVAVTSYIKSI